MRNKGINQHRFKQNPIEKAFAEEWERLHSTCTSINDRGILDYILAKDINHPNGEVSERDREVAATVIQWLGSPVGQRFLKKVKDLVKKGN
jgi:hypothetical protein